MTELPTIEMIFSDAASRAAQRALESTDTEQSRFNVAVSPKTRVFLETQAQEIGGSLAGLCGVLLDAIVTHEIEKFAERSNQRIKVKKQYKIELDGLPFCYYGDRAYGWGLKDSIQGKPGQIVLFDMLEEAQEYIAKRKVFFGGAQVVEQD